MTINTPYLVSNFSDTLTVNMTTYSATSELIHVLSMLMSMNSWTLSLKWLLYTAPARAVAVRWLQGPSSRTRAEVCSVRPTGICCLPAPVTLGITSCGQPEIATFPTNRKYLNTIIFVGDMTNGNRDSKHSLTVLLISKRQCVIVYWSRDKVWVIGWLL